MENLGRFQFKNSWRSSQFGCRAIYDRRIVARLRASLYILLLYPPRVARSRRDERRKGGGHRSRQNFKICSFKATRGGSLINYPWPDPISESDAFRRVCNRGTGEHPAGCRINSLKREEK